MEATALSVGKSVLNGVLSYAQSAVAEEVALQLGVRRDQVFITNELEMMRAFLMAARDDGGGGDDGRNMVVKVWVKQVRDVAYDVEDSLQDFAVRLEKQSWWRLRRTLLDRRHVAKQMKELRANVEDVSQRNMRYRLINAGAGAGSGSSSRPAAFSGVQSAIAGATTTMSGTEEARRWREKARADLARLINNKKMDDHLRVIAVSGTARSTTRHHLGETTNSVVKRVYEDPEIHSKFERHAWISLMRPFNLTEFLRSMIEQFHVNFLQDQQAEQKEKATNSVEVQALRKMAMTKDGDLACEFMKYVNDKSCLVVLNCVHNVEEWGQIKSCFQNNKKRSRIIVCAEQVGVASLCVGPEDAAPEYKQLLLDQSLYAFYEKGSQDGTDSTEAGSTSNIDIGISSYTTKKLLNRTETMLAAYKESHLIGREREKTDIITLITDNDSYQCEIISVWGMGGLGKITLIRDVYQSQELSRKFEKRACVTIMRPFNLVELIKNLAVQFNCTPEDMEKEVEGKKCLIVLNDIASITEWETIIPYFSAMETSSRIIITTRLEDIAKHCSKKHEKIYKLQGLGDQSARDLLREKVFHNANLDEHCPELVEQANLILKKCKGLPLAIVTIGGFLANRPKNALEWKKLNDHISAELQMNPELGVIITVLNKSYDGLPYHLKACFLYLSIFPENYMINYKRLLRRWIAEGYTSVVRDKSADEIAQSYLMELMSRSMVLPSQESIYSIRGMHFCQVHDLIREIGISKSMEEDLVFRLEGGYCSSNIQAGTTRHLAINGNWEGDESEFVSMVDMSHVRSVTIFGQWRPFFISEKMRLLRVLDLEDTRGLRDHHLRHIGRHLHLRYLSLRGCRDIHHLPDSLGNLRQLHTLDMRDTSIMLLPKTIVKLGKLQYLHAGTKRGYTVRKSAADLSSGWCPLLATGRLLCAAACCASQIMGDGGFSRRDACTYACCTAIPGALMDLDHGGVMVPRGTRKLKALHTLQGVDVAPGDVVLEEIKRLTGLRKLGVTGITERNVPGFCSVISNLTRLESLSVRSDTKCLDRFSLTPSNIQSLSLYGYMNKLPEWMGQLQKLIKLKLTFGTMEQLDQDDAVQLLGTNLPNLSVLRLSVCLFGGQELCFKSNTFRSLMVLELRSLWVIKSVRFDQGSVPKLELLQLRDFFLGNRFLCFGLDLLSNIKEVWVNVGFGLEQVRAQLAANPNKPILKVK